MSDFSRGHFIHAKRMENFPIPEGLQDFIRLVIYRGDSRQQHWIHHTVLFEWKYIDAWVYPYFKAPVESWSESTAIEDILRTIARWLNDPRMRSAHAIEPITPELVCRALLKLDYKDKSDKPLPEESTT